MRRSTRTSIKRVIPESDSSEDEEEQIKKIKVKRKKVATKLESSGSSGEDAKLESSGSSSEDSKFESSASSSEDAKLESSDSSSEDEFLAKIKIKKVQTPVSSIAIKKTLLKVKKEKSNSLPDSSSSESDIENYLKPAHELDFNSTFFDVIKPPEKKTFDSVESAIFDGVNVDKLSDSESESDTKASEEPVASTSKADFHQLKEYTQRLEQAKEAVEKYEANKKLKQVDEKKSKAKKQKTDEEKLDILNLLARGEAKTDASVNPQTSFHSSDYESFSDSEKEDWHEIEHKAEKEEKKDIIPKEGVQVTVALPGASVVKKKKELDVLASIKRRLNRVRKENQVLVHKVHLLCWIAHGNFVNKVLNNENLMALALSLIPSQHCYPPARTDLSYLEQIVKWYQNTMPLVEKEQPSDMGLEDFLKLQINVKKAYDKRMLVYIFICIMRSLGIHCRLVLSFQVTALRPPANELHSLSTKNQENEKKANKASGSKESERKATRKSDKPKLSTLTSKGSTASPAKVEKTASKEKQSLSNAKSKKEVEVPARTRGKSTSSLNNNKEENVKIVPENSKRRSRSTNDEIKPTRKSSKVAEKSTKPKLGSLLKVPQVDGPNDSDEEIAASQATKPNLKRLSQKAPAKNYREDETGSDDDFRTKPTRKGPNLKNLKDIKSRPTQVSSKKEKEIVKENGRGGRSKSTSASKEIASKDSTKSAKEIESNENGRATRSKSTSASKETKSKDSNKTVKSKSTANKEEKGKNGQSEKSKPTSSRSKPDKGVIKYKSYANKESKDAASDVKPKEKLTNGKSSSKSTATSKEVEPQSNDKKLRSKSTSNKLEASKTTSKKVESPFKGFDVRNDIISIMKGRIAQERQTERGKKVKSRKTHHSSDEDSDYVPIANKKQYDSDDEYYKETKVKVKQRVKPRKELEAMEDMKTKKGIDFWVEVFLEAEEKWITVDLFKGKVHCVKEIYSRASHPVTYIVAWNNDSTIKDISQRYCPNWNTVTRLLRINKTWWDETIKPFMGSKNARDKEEDEELALFHLEKPLPTTISEYKNHPLYALKRHLLKFQVFYPPNPVSLGFVRGEPVYSRDCVKTVCSREKWYKEAKVVKPGEQPYKIVVRTTYDKYQKKFLQNQPLEVFGDWQIEDYVPPPAVNGIVPKNEYGNVEIFKECMIPGGTVHLRLAGLNKIARKMDIDCPAAMVGFDVHHGWTHPMFDGFIVCEEHAETLIAAWHMDQEEQEEKEREKTEKRVYDNWKKLIKGLLIKERLKKRYNFGEKTESEAAGGSKKRKAKGPKFTCKKRRLANENESDER